MPCLIGLPHAHLLPLSALIPSSVVTLGFFLFLESARVLLSLDLCTCHCCLQNSSSSPASFINVLHTAARGRLLQSGWPQLPPCLPKASHLTGNTTQGLDIDLKDPPQSGLSCFYDILFFPLSLDHT